MAVLDLLCSPPGTGKTTYCIDSFKDKILESKGGIDSRSFFILPNREHAERIRNLILKQEVPGLFNAHILTLHDFILRLSASSRSMARPTDAIRKRVLRDVLQEEGRSFPYFEKVKTFPGFYELLVDTIKEFKGALLSIREFEKRAQTLLKDPVFRVKFRDFTVLMKAYETELVKMCLEELEDPVAQLLQTSPRADLADLVIFDGFYHFTRAQQKFIAYLCGHSGRVVATLTLPQNYRSRLHVFDYPVQTREFLLNLGFRETRSSDSPNHRTGNESLRHLQQNLFLEKPSLRNNPKRSIEVLEANSLRGEVEMIAREIKRLYRESVTHYSDICIILRKIGSYRQLVRSVFAEFGIPVVVHEREKLIEHGLAMALYRFMNLIGEDWSREDLFYFLKSSYLRRAVPPQEVSELESAAFRDNILGGRSRWEALRHSGLKPEAQTLLQKIFEWENGLLGAKTIHEFTRQATELLSEFDLESPAAVDADAVDAEVVSTITDILENAKKFYRRAESRPFSAALFVKEFKDSLKSALFSIKPGGKNRVQVYDVVMAIPKEYKTVFIAGLLEKVFPQSVAEDPLFKDAERRVINQREALLEERRRRVTGERYFFYMGISRAKERLYLTYPKVDTEGRPALRSFFIEEVKKCFTAVSEVRKDASDLVPGWHEWETEREVVQGLSEILFRPQDAGAGKRLSLPAPVLKAIGVYVKTEALQEVLHAAFSPAQALIRDSRIRQIFADTQGPFSATRLETFVTFAFKYFSERILKLGQPPEGREFLEMGNLLHKVLEEFYNELSEADRKSGRIWNEEGLASERLQKKLSQAVEKNPLSFLPLYRRRICETRMKRALRLFVEQEKRSLAERSLVPAYFEYAFDDLRLGQGVDRFVIKGKIDRVDVDPNSRKALVVDYKLSRRPVSIRRKVSQGLELQIPLYILAVKRLLGLEVIGGELRFLSVGGSDGLYLESERDTLSLPGRRALWSGEAFEAMLSGTEDLVGQTVKRLRSADISIRSKSCDYCPYSPVCRFERWQLVYENDGE